MSTKLKRYKTALEIIGIVAALVFSIISVFQSQKAIDISRKELEIEQLANQVVLNVNGAPIENSYVNIEYLPDTMKSVGASVLSYKFEVRIDNLSSRKVSIRKIYAETFLDGKLLDLHGRELSTGFSGPFFLEEGLSQREVALPITMDEGESLNFITTYGLLLDEESTQVIREYLQGTSDKNITLADVRKILGRAGVSLGRSKVEFQEFDDGSWISMPLEPPKIEIRIVVITSFGTRHFSSIFVN